LILAIKGLFVSLHSVAGTGCIEKWLMVHSDQNEMGIDFKKEVKMSDRFYHGKRMAETGPKSDGNTGDAAAMIRRAAVVLEKNRRKNNCLVVGVTGSVACGKSTVSRMLEDFGALLIDFDRIAREVVMPGTPGYDRIISDFGTGVVQPGGALDRKVLSDLVFADEKKRRHLERITHPLIFEIFAEKVADLGAARPDAVIQVAVPLLIELNMQHLFDKVIVVYLPRDIQLERLAVRDNISFDAAAAIIGSQLSPDEKLPFADYVIDNSRDRAHTREQVNRVWQQLRQDKKQLHQDNIDGNRVHE
jgi:dephospho-CoA kinase